MSRPHGTPVLPYPRSRDDFRKYLRVGAAPSAAHKHRSIVRHFLLCIRTLGVNNQLLTQDDNRRTKRTSDIEKRCAKKVFELTFLSMSRPIIIIPTSDTNRI